MILNPLLVILSVLSGLEAYKILVFYPTPSYSHQRAIISLTERLVKDGHQLFVISPNVVPVSIQIFGDNHTAVQRAHS